MAFKPSTQITSWSASRFFTYDLCPAQAKYKFIDKLSEPTNEAMQRGTDIHKMAEMYIKGQGRTIPKELTKFTDYFKELRKNYKKVNHMMFIEDSWAYRNDWSQTTYNDWNGCWLRVKLDCAYHDKELKTLHVDDFKGLALDTKLPTPSGFTTMGAVNVGDVLFSESGEQCKVVGKSEIKNINCFEVKFSDNTKVVCDEEHLWKLADGSVTPITKLSIKDKVAVAAPLSIPDADLPIDPYVFGLWIADGKHTSGEICKPDSFVWDEIGRRGYSVNMATGVYKDKTPCRTVKGIRGHLRRLGVFGNKHIPDIYLRAGYQQRLDLLRGLMDGDGYANAVRRQCVYTTVDSKLSDKVCELLCSLGQKPLKNHTTQHGFGKTVKAYPVSFKPLGINPFLLPRKADRVLVNWGEGKATFREVKEIVKIPSVQTQCIAVDSLDHTFLCTDRMIPTHNTGKFRPDESSNYIMQLELYALAALKRYPHLEEVRPRLVYLDTGDIYPPADAPLVFKRADVPKLEKIWAKRIKPMLTDKRFLPKPNAKCRFCNFSRDRGGPCRY